MTSTGLRIYTTIIALICGAAVAWSIHQSSLATSWQADARSWHHGTAIARADTANRSSRSSVDARGPDIRIDCRSALNGRTLDRCRWRSTPGRAHPWIMRCPASHLCGGGRRRQRERASEQAAACQRDECPCHDAFPSIRYDLRNPVSQSDCMRTEDTSSLAVAGFRRRKATAERQRHEPID